MPSAGALQPPFITPTHTECHGIQFPVNKIDSSTLIDLSTEVPNCKIYFTTDGSKPLPFQRKIGGKERTFKYFAPFRLKVGKRTLKAVAVARDVLLESAVVSKDFNVIDLNNGGVSSSDRFERSVSCHSFIDESSDEECYLMSDKAKNVHRRKSPTWKRMQSAPTRKGAWADLFYQDPTTTGAFNDGQYPQIPESPFNPINYSGTQVNVWGAPPGSVPEMYGNDGMVRIRNLPQNPHYPVQTGFLTEQMIRHLPSQHQ